MFKRKSVNIAALLALGVALPALAQQQLDKVEITGSSIKRIDAETALPVSVINRETINKSGVANVQELVDRLSYNNGGGLALGQSIGDGSANGQTGASLRGLGRSRTLVLLNGRRMPVYPFSGQGVDLNSIPLAAIERIEVLRDGASATYGSDAIGGVMNFITRKDYQGGELSVGLESPHKVGDVFSLSGGFGFGDLAKQKFNVMGTFNYQTYDAIRAADRGFASTGNRPDIGVVKDSGNTFPANAVIPSTGQYVPLAANYPVCAPPDSYAGSSNCRYDYTHYIDLIPQQDRYGALVKGTLAANENTTLFAEVAYSRNEMILGSSQTPSTTTGKPAYLYPGGGKWYPTAAVDAVLPGYRGPLRISWRMVDGGQRRTKVTNDVTRTVIGAEGSLAGFDYKGAVVYAEGKAREDYVSGIFSDTKLVQALATGLINPFGANDAAGLAALRGAELSGNARNSKTSNAGVDLTLTRELFSVGAGNAAIAVGGEFRKEKYNDGYSELAGSGDIVGGSGTAGKVAADRDVTGLFAEMNFPVLSSLELNAAVRHDRYSSTQGQSRDGSYKTPNLSSTSPKLSLRFTPMTGLLFRAAAGKGFRAPALDNMFAPSSLTNTGGNFTDPNYDQVTGCTAAPNTDYCDTQLTTQTNSNTQLKPEKSKTFTAGVVFEMIKDTTIGVDYFDMKITNGLRYLSGDDIMRDWLRHRTGPNSSTSIFANRLVVDPATGYLNYIRGSWENVGKINVSGFDFSARTRVRTDFGSFTPGWEATLLTKSEESIVGTGSVRDNLGKYNLGGPVVRFKQTFTLDWDLGNWGASARYNRQNGYEDYDEVSKVKAYDLVDLQGQYRGIKNVTLTAGFRNLLDKKPPTTVQEDYFQVGFDPTYADVKGRTFYLRGTYKF
ncbi:TonB-dependent receptor [Roseateles amylovorans]|uniref:TonB-dependent receptor n=1 Tax=Roseateles amylovorans TaxID=2978473 RepID=A0ABY6B520_9BURK|nr:TonB-dependent receptor [Roseateles amylovorans]UXH80029.1 TonB-dependent receptor [Roseateles amylovorans]